jgi:glycosyltransferase involved in cell wall biosynthesis
MSQTMNASASAARAAPPLRILEMCTIFGVGGIARHVLELSAWMKAQGHQVDFAGSPGAWLNPGLQPGFVELTTQDVSGDGDTHDILSRVTHVFRSARALRAWLKKNPVDVIHAHESAPALVARVATLGMNIPIAVTYHGSHIGRVPQFGAIARFSTDLTLTVSHRSARDLASLGKVPTERLKVIGLGVKPPPAIDAARVAALRSQLLGPDGELLVVMIARLSEQKGIDVFIQAARAVVAQRPDIRFAVVGDGPQEAEALAWAEAAGVAGHVTFVGRSEEPHLYLAAADIFLLTSRWEALPFTIAEAFQNGVPAIATDCGGVAELIDDTVGRVLPVGDAPAIASAILEVAGDDALRARMAAAAKARSREDRFSPDHIHRQIEQTYRDLAKAKAHGRAS